MVVQSLLDDTAVGWELASDTCSSTLGKKSYFGQGVSVRLSIPVAAEWWASRLTGLWVAVNSVAVLSGLAFLATCEKSVSIQAWWDRRFTRFSTGFWQRSVETRRIFATSGPGDPRTRYPRAIRYLFSCVGWRSLQPRQLPPASGR
jgi:hypothetical protein